jgi:hypothetical protein
MTASAQKVPVQPTRAIVKREGLFFQLDLGQFGATAKNDPFGRREGAGQSHL